MDLSVNGVETKGREDERKTPSAEDENRRRKIINGKKTVESSQTVARGIIYEKCLAAPRWSLRKDIDAGFDAILRKYPAVLSNEPKRDYTELFTVDKKLLIKNTRRRQCAHNALSTGCRNVDRCKTRHIIISSGVRRNVK